MWVSPFRYPWITGYLHLPMAFRSLSRLSSALSAKASTLRSYSLNLTPSGVSDTRLFMKSSGRLRTRDFMNERDDICVATVMK